MTDLAVIFDELPTRGGGRIGVATLNSQKSLNALTLDMARQLDAKLEAWAVDRSIVAVWLEGAGEKAFCAGGDVVALYHSMTEEGDNCGAGRDSLFAETYFTTEYRLDYRIHTYPKPVLVWGDGIVMGGGLGLMAGASRRLATQTTLIAMPEITIGLYPDIGASWFLNRMPRGVGAYLGLTGAQLNARDALDLGLADHFVPRERRDALLEALGEADYGSHSPRDLEAGVQRVLDELEDRTQAPDAQVWPLVDHLQALCGQVDAPMAVKRILQDDRDHAWLAANRKRLEAGSPLSAHLVWRMLERHRHTSLADAFRDELNLSVQCCRQGDIAEGVRALLIDKDKNPKWLHESADKVPEADLQALLAPLWNEEEHPLSDLGSGKRWT
ncbi:enoyl-CoA hydratase/isomerase family protein [Billgrantia diversa]|uniref:enoyl-CoA hydratase/isomerase family protein n=1 Tax=Halomonas sp. MCCC 1A13316 TaxID=2733487 RepID=UPI0018A37365|nr:enoyl-CoA hydratase/isomerase family protein [Halomonas sp. MCCC 1A13316]QOR38699.1 enoyl-CoA hydratase/isomerase family protein [Halomonas sp. MCCC 1A13316]